MGTICIREISDDTVSFRITGINMNMLQALSKYAQMLDHVTNAAEDERLNVEGVINSILNDGMTKEIKDICKRHGFIDMEDFMESMSECRDGEEVAHTCKLRESIKLKKDHDKILAHIPIDDKQCRIPFEEN